MASGMAVRRQWAQFVPLICQRIEPRCRDDDFSRGLEARTADPLWLLARQWQVGEFQAQDAGSPIRVSVTAKTNYIREVEPGTSGVKKDLLDDGPPLEAVVEHEHVTRQQLEQDWRMRVQIGQQFERLLRAELGDEAVQSILSSLRQLYSVAQPTAEQHVELDRATQRFLCVMAGRAIDGGKLLVDAQSGVDGMLVLPRRVSSELGDNVNAANIALGKLREWFESLYGKLAVSEPSAWVASSLEYTFKVHAERVHGPEILPGISPDLLRRLKDALRRPPIPSVLRSVFADERLRPWRDKVPTADHPADRVDAIVDFLHHRYSDTGENALVVLLHVLRDHIDRSDACYWDLVGLESELEREVTSPIRPVAPAGVAAPITLIAPEYRNGDLDWYTFSILGDPEIADDAPVETQDFVPTRVSFYGMPHARWWAFEDNQTDFGNLDTTTTDLAKMMIMQFALIYGDDWFIIPLPVEIGTLTRIESLWVTDVFGVKTRIEPARSASENAWARWQIFHLSARNDPGKVGEFLFLPPTLGFREESPPLEEVRLFRDEMANMVWAVEHTIPNHLGQPVGGFEAQVERRSREREAEAQTAVAEQVAELGLPQYRLATTVPANWIPYVPVREPGSDRSVYLRQAAMLRSENDTAEPTMAESMSRLLTGVDGVNALVRLREEAVTRAGQKYQLTRQRVRWLDGRTHVWVGRKVVAGRGEGSSGLRFDVLQKLRE